MMNCSALNVNLKMIQEYEGFYSIKEKLRIMRNMTYKELLNFKEEFKCFQGRVMMQNSALYSCGIYGPPKPMYKQMEEVDKLIQKVSNSNYYLPEKAVVINNKEKVNGYLLYGTNSLMEEDAYKFLCKIWNDENNNLEDKDKFMEKYDKNACTEWGKMDETGGSFGGFWDYPEGTYERENASQLTKEKNGEALYKLPYPKKFILHTVDIGCSNRTESVRYSNFLCEWMKRKMTIMND